MGPNAFIIQFIRRFERTDIPIRGQGYQPKMKTSIGDDVWIGRQVMFTPGRRVKDGTIIAAAGYGIM